MTDFVDYYEVLGVSPDASKTVIQTAYRKLIKKYHPDRIEAARAQLQAKGVSPDLIDDLISDRLAEAELKSRAINDAYAVLSDLNQRRTFHAQRKAAKAAAAQPAGAPASRTQPRLVITPDKVDLGPLVPGYAKPVQFSITNAGDPVSGQLTITKWHDISWISNQKATPDPLNTFPLRIEFIVNTTGLDEGVFKETLEIIVDGSTATFTLEFEVRREPKLVVTPSSIFLDPVYPGQQQTINFVIDNLGGKIRNKLQLKSSSYVPWVKDKRLKRVTVGQSFPIAVEIDIDTTGLGRGQYRDYITAEVDGYQVRFSFGFDVVLPPEPPPPPPPPPDKFWWVDHKTHRYALMYLVGLWGAILYNIVSIQPPLYRDTHQFHNYFWPVLFLLPSHIIVYWVVRRVYWAVSEAESHISTALICIALWLAALFLGSGGRTPVIGSFDLFEVALIALPGTLCTLLLNLRSSRLHSRRMRIWLNAIAFCTLLPAIVFLNLAAGETPVASGLFLAWTINTFLLIL